MKVIVLIFGLILTVTNSVAQADYPYPSLSPKGKIFQIVGNTSIEVEYERPSARKRKVFGELVPWNKVWRTGAGHCTKIRFDKPVVIEGQQIPKGYYSLLSIPNPEDWIVILNKDTTLYGSYFYKSEHDVARFVVIPQKSNRFYETLTIDIDLIPNNARIYLSWENTQIAFDILTSIDSDMERYIREKVMTGKSTDPDIYAGAAEYMLYQGTNLYEALNIADKALKLDKDSWARNVKISLYEKLRLYQDAIEEINKALEMARKRTYEKEEHRTNRINELEKILERISNKQK